MALSASSFFRFSCVAGVCLVMQGCGAGLMDLGRHPEMSGIGSSYRDTPPQPNLASIPAGTPHLSEKPTSNSLWQSGPESLFGDRRAKNVGDILTVLIEIDDKAQMDNKTERDRQDDNELGISNLFGLETLASKILPGEAGLAPAISTGSSMKTKGDGKIDRSEKVELKVAAMITDVLPNGNLVLRGSQEVRVNYELRDLQVTGIIRPHDISRRNTITYEKIAEARISYGGRGQLQNLQQPRVGSQIMDKILPF